MTLPRKTRFCLLRFGLLGAVVILGGFVTQAYSQGLISPLHGYLSIEPFEVRQEYVFRFDTVSERLGETLINEITPRNRSRLEAAIGQFLTGKSPVTIDGMPAAMKLDRVHFVRPDPEKGLVIDERESIPVTEALVGVVFASSVGSPPREVSVIWEVFPANGEEAIVEAGIRGQRVARRLSPGENSMTWRNEGGLVAPELLAIPEAPEMTKGIGSRWTVAFLLGGVGLLLIGAGKLGKKENRRILASSGLALLGLAIVMVVARPKASPLQVSAEEADEIVYALLRNIYHAFDYRRESDIYDVLAESAEGDLLTRIYLEVSRSLEIENQGGARVRVTDLDLRKCELEESTPGAPAKVVTHCEWVAVGTVTHWGHTHDRVNRYRATIQIAPRDRAWRLVDLKLQSEERIDVSPPGTG